MWLNLVHTQQAGEIHCTRLETRSGGTCLSLQVSPGFCVSFVMLCHRKQTPLGLAVNYECLYTDWLILAGQNRSECNKTWGFFLHCEQNPRMQPHFWHVFLFFHCCRSRKTNTFLHIFLSKQLQCMLTKKLKIMKLLM